MDDVGMSREDAQRAVIRARVRTKLESRGVERVRADLADGVGLTPFQAAVMREWLADKVVEANEAQQAKFAQSEREKRMDAANAESLQVARSAKNAAWVAAGVAALALAIASYAALREFPVIH